jgi:hypothetical protein
MKYRGFLYQTFFRQTFFICSTKKKISTKTGKLQVCLVRPRGQEAVNKALFSLNVFFGRYLKRLTLLLLIREIPGSELGPANPLS